MRLEKIMKNGVIGLVTQVIVLVMGFLTQIVFTHYLGQTNYGLNSVISNLLNMLSLAELGVGSAITYHLYKPIAEGDQNTIASIMALFRRVYWTIGFVVFGLGCLLMLLIPVFITESGVDIAFVRLIFFIQLMSTVSTYFLSYKRTLLYADQRNYVCALYDTLMNIIFSVFRIVSLVLYQDYVIYSVLMVLQQIAANLLISYYCNKRYPQLKDKNIKPYDKAKNLFVDTKNILVGKVAVYIYSSTDNLVISTFSSITGGLFTVGGLNYYVYITNAIRTIVNSVLYSMAPAIGNFLQSGRDRKEMYPLFHHYTFVRHFIATVSATGLIVCSTPLVYMCYGGEQAVMPQIVVLLISLDVFISITSGPINELISVLGLFHYEKYLNAIGAAMNLISSIIFVQFIGVPGVLLGTVISQLFFWISKCILVFRKYFEDGMAEYWRKIAAYTAVDIVQVIGLLWLCGRLFPVPSVGGFIGAAALCVAVPFVLVVIVFHRTKEFQFAYQLTLGVLSKLRRVKK